MMILTAKTLITGDGKTCLKDHGILVDEAGKIAAVAPLHELKQNNPGVSVRDYGDATILPGLIDMHVHVGYRWFRDDTPQFDDYLSAYYSLYVAREALKLGVTTIRDASSPGSAVVKIKNAAARGWYTAPRMIPVMHGIAMSGGHCYMLRGGVIEVDGVEPVRSAIRQQIRDGAEWIKIFSSHRTHTPEYTQPELDAAVDEGHRLNRKLMVHSGTRPSIQMCIDAGFDTIEHGTYLEVEQAIQMKEKDLTWTPTIIAYGYIYETNKKGMENGTMKKRPDFEYFRDATFMYRDKFPALMETGVRIITGSDMVLQGSPICPVVGEMEYFEQFGMPTLECIKTATYNGAEVLGKLDEFGEIAVGKLADLDIVAGDASKTVKACNNVLSVYQSGREVYTKEHGLVE